MEAASVPMDERVKCKKGPFRVELEAGTNYHFCDCGRSQNQPFCDGSHQGTPFTPISFTVPESKTYSICGCKYSNNKPYCDGMHNKIQW
mmetsp:Transcript_8486/g.12537  ORF Transcript_8486/g.12537 Transcript_8486/m.12537 type:complete len:89 (-) Transcript_8486:33-299(-)